MREQKQKKLRNRLIREINLIRDYQDFELPTLSIRELKKERKLRWKIFIGKANLF